MNQIQLTDEEKSIIARNRETLKKNDLKHFYSRIPNGYGGRITQFLIERGINVFDYFTELPNYMLAGSELETISIPEHIDKIGKHVFENCENLKAVDIGDSVRVIDDGAFRGCSNLKRVFLPDSLRILGSNIFKGCPEDIVLIANKRSGATKLRCKQGEIPWYKEHLFLNQENSEEGE